MLAKNSDLPPKSPQIKQDKFFSRLLSKETSMANSSFRVYYGVAPGAVPFNWESQPGTPKKTFSNSHLPPLTPPPSFHSPSQKRPMKKPSKPNPFNIILPRLSLKKTHSPHFSSSSISPSPTTLNLHGGRRISSSASSSSSLSSWGGDEDVIGSPTNPWCFGPGQGATSGMPGCYPMVIAKNALLSIVCRGYSTNQGSRRGTTTS